MLLDIVYARIDMNKLIIKLSGIYIAGENEVNSIPFYVIELKASSVSLK